MRKKIGISNELTLLELIIVIGLFAVFSAANLQIFSSAHKLSLENDRLSHAIIVAEDAAECFKAGLEPALFYNADWLPAEENSAEYMLTLESTAQNGVSTAEITVTGKNGDELFALTAKAPTEVSP